ncbi:sulfite oxidase heme-binding subunit YedZ [Campylobacter peloridis]|uniref:Sulfite oxidase heme-binding subunit YedZ n=1 Tax=Campylobacter peloridis TaxID=488546 RepID=A0ABX6TY85_9BACT|nr:ferric reductase [Campylobacter peloridis]AJC84995.1 periplasmic DMSO/TMAO reductase YedYZ, heme-binding membrane subunit [Campylobacter peloridis LMG 23910]QOQ89029.1 sulfite oxidase heme-binding subunit YedZ [Campylobacter peloridis]
MSKKNCNIIAFLFFILSIFYSFYQIKQEFDIVKSIYFYSGIFSLIFFGLSLLFSLLKYKYTKDYPKFLGFYAFFWAIVHFINYFAFGKNLNFIFFLKDTFNKNLEFSGFIAFFLLTLMFISSFKFFNKLIKIRKLAYICFLIASWHYFLSAKIPQISHILALSIAVLFLLTKIWKNHKKRKKVTSF